MKTTRDATRLEIDEWVIFECSVEGTGWQVNRKNDRQRRNLKTKEALEGTVESFIGYYSDLPNCLKAILKYGYTNQGRVLDFQQLISRQEYLYSQLLKVINTK